ncbi:MAG: NAD(P)/FAD-dependent oxidoreductase [Nitrososphaerota archaeon]|nr:NAD(P)/FAD-dependent oxidoreductase [Nitrososphaerota archaeon]MDG6939064.1 NAD(P)/FAD-dependent oxidoreductase [Nitrososphaerota archaeon]
MKIAVAGMGPAGSYLAALLSGKHQVDVYEGQTEERFTSVCGWATAYGGTKEALKEVGLDFDDYVLHRGREMYVSAFDRTFPIDAPELVTFDKPRMIRDVAKGLNVRYGSFVRQGDLESKYDLVVDATGPYRRILGPVQEGRDMILPTFQWLVRYKDMPFDDFYIEPFDSFSGYLWYFPLGDHDAFVGAGDIQKGHRASVEGFLKKHPPSEKVATMGKPIRVAAPSSVLPHYGGNVVGVGEAIGTVYPILGEGILPSMTAAKMLSQMIDDREGYSRGVRSRFSAYDLAYGYIIRKMEHTDNLLNSFIPAVKIFLWFKKNFDITGVNPSIIETLRVLRPRKKATQGPTPVTPGPLSP